MEADFRKLISRAINFCRFQFRIQTERDQLRKHGVLSMIIYYRQTKVNIHFVFIK